MLYTFVHCQVFLYVFAYAHILQVVFDISLIAVSMFICLNSVFLYFCMFLNIIICIWSFCILWNAFKTFVSFLGVLEVTVGWRPYAARALARAWRQHEEFVWERRLCVCIVCVHVACICLHLQKHIKRHKNVQRALSTTKLSVHPLWNMTGGLVYAPCISSHMHARNAQNIQKIVTTYFKMIKAIQKMTRTLKNIQNRSNIYRTNQRYLMSMQKERTKD